EYDSRYPGNDPVYIDIPKDELPHCENLQMTIDRVVPYYKDIICPQITNNKKVIISAHGNSLRALVKVLDNMTDDEVMDLNIPTGIPLVYELDECLQVIRKHYI
ncbi:MAG: 2,3-bisphosphoglycerate-dependent phosphoglycerate mutase, partial [Candidatus Riflemargulisbacteria bacterium]